MSDETAVAKKQISKVDLASSCSNLLGEEARKLVHLSHASMELGYGRDARDIADLPQAHPGLARRGAS